jgi:hypothetical protein
MKNSRLLQVNGSKLKQPMGRNVMPMLTFLSGRFQTDIVKSAKKEEKFEILFQN